MMSVIAAIQMNGIWLLEDGLILRVLIVRIGDPATTMLSAGPPVVAPPASLLGTAGPRKCSSLLMAQDG